MLDAWLEGEAGERLTNLEHGRLIRLRVELEVLGANPGLGVGFILANADGVGVFQFGGEIVKSVGNIELTAGDRVTVRADVENLLTPGRYTIHCGINRAHTGDVALYVHDAVGFVVFGGEAQPQGIVSLPHELSTAVDPGGTG